MGFDPILYNESNYFLRYRISDYVGFEFEFDEDIKGWKKKRAKLSYIGIYRDKLPPAL